MPRTSLFLLIGAVVLGIVAVVIARFYLTSAPAPLAAVAPVAPSLAKAVVAAAPIKFGEKIDPNLLKLADYPVASMPAGSYPRIEDAVGAGDRIALRAIDINEVVLAKAVSGAGNRLSTSGLIGPDRRAVTIKIGELAGVAGMIVPGDHVDVMVTRQSGGERPEMFTTLLLQDLRVLAIDQELGPPEKPRLGSTATLEVPITQAPKLVLAQTVGTVTLMLRSVTDLAGHRPTVTRLSALGGSADAPRARRARARGPSGNKVEIVRAGQSQTYVVPRG